MDYLGNDDGFVQGTKKANPASGVSRRTNEGVLSTLRGRKSTTGKYSQYGYEGVNPEMGELAQLGLLPKGYPNYEENPFQSNIPQLDQRLGGLQGMNAFRQEALRTGPSAWAGLAQRRLGNEQQDAQQKLMQSSLGQTSGAMSRLAMGGGLSSGARERIATQGARNTFEQGQALNRDYSQQRLGIDIADEGNRSQMLSQLPGLEYQTQVSPWLALANREGERGDERSASRNAFNLGRFNTQMSAYGSLKTAQAQRKA